MGGMRGVGAMRAGTARAMAVVAAAALAAGCGSTFDLPTESRNRLIPTDGSYQRVADWTALPDVQDVLLVPRGQLSQLYLLFNHGGAGVTPRGELWEYVLVRPERYENRVFSGMFNPIAVASGNNRLWVLDQGDTCIARSNPRTGACNDTTGGWKNAISHLDQFWWVREYLLTAGNPVESFTDTSLAFVTGIAADENNFVYVAGVRIRFVPNQEDQRLRDKLLEYGVFRYVPGIRPDGNSDFNVIPADSWHRDTTFLVTQGTGTGSAIDPRGIFWGVSPSGHNLYVADFGNNEVKKMFDEGISPGVFTIDGSSADSLFVGPVDVTADPPGHIFAVDGGNRRVLRFDPNGSFVQRVNVEGDALVRPTAVAADDSICFVADPGAARVIRYKRRQP